MTVDDLKRRYDYGYWANQRIFGVIAQLTTAEFTQDVAGSWGSIRNTLVHTMSAEWGWIDRCGGPPRGPALKADDYPSAESLIRQWNAGRRSRDLSGARTIPVPQRASLALWQHRRNHP